MTSSVTVQLSNAPPLRPIASDHLKRKKNRKIGMSIKIILNKPSTCKLSSHPNLTGSYELSIGSRTSGFGLSSLGFAPWDLLLGASLVLHPFICYLRVLRVPSCNDQYLSMRCHGILPMGVLSTF